MAKLYFKYGAMGSSKTAQSLITKFNYEEKGMTVWLIKPGTDTRDGAKADPDLPSEADGKEVKYTVKEVSVPKGYTASYKEKDGTTTITNTKLPPPT